MKINNFILIFILLIIGLSNIYASGQCWEAIVCDKGETATGSIISTDYVNNEDFKEEYCEILGIKTEMLSQFEIEIIQGQFEGGVKTIRIFVDNVFLESSDKINFVLSKATSPTYVLCHEVQQSSGATENPIRLGTRDFWTASYDQQWFKQNAGMPEYEGYESLKNWNQNQTYNNSDRNSLHTTNEETTTQKTNNDNRILWILTFIGIAILIYINWLLTYRNGYSIIFWILNALIIPSAYIVIPSGQFPYLLLATMFCIFIVIIELGKWLTKRRM